MRAGFADVAAKRRVRGTGVTVDFVAHDRAGGRWHVLVGGPHIAHGGGLLRLDVVWRTMGRAAALRGRQPDTPVLVLTTDPPRRASEGDMALRAAVGVDQLIVDVVDVTSVDCSNRLAHHAQIGSTEMPDLPTEP